MNTFGNKKRVVRQCVAAFLMMSVLASCTQSGKSDSDQNRQLLKKENELLKKENELLKKEQQLSQPSGSQTNRPGNASGNLAFLAGLKDKYPHEIKLFDNEILKTRLQQMLGSQYDYLRSIWEVETPVEINNGLMYTWAMQAHSGGDPGAVLMADISKNVLYVAIRKEGEVKTYSEDGSAVPQRLQDWADE